MMTAVSCKVQGYMHRAHELPCQDYTASMQIPQGMIMAVADGHGNAMHKYSEFGSQIATETALAVLKEFCQSYPTAKKAQLNLSDLPVQIEMEWKKRVLQFHANLQTEQEQDVLTAQNQALIEVLYGTTLLAVICTTEYLVALSIGDGDVIQLSHQGQMQYILTPSERYSNTTYSLCMQNCAQFFQMQWMDFSIADTMPMMIFLSTDGYANSYTSNEAFFAALQEYYQIAQDKGTNEVAERLPDMLEDVTKTGSGDDVTIAMLFCDKENKNG